MADMVLFDQLVTHRIIPYRSDQPQQRHQP